MLALVGDHHPLAGGADQRQREIPAFHCPAVRALHLLGVDDEHELRKVVAHRGARQMLAGGKFVSIGEGLTAQLFVDHRARAPGAAPVLPALDAGSDFLEVGKRHAVRYEARRPVRDRRLYPGIRH